MNFAEFSQKICAEIKNGDDTYDFIKLLFANAITDSEKNPFKGVGYDTFMSYYRGKRDFPKDIALSIEKNYDRDKLYNFILNRYKNKDTTQKKSYKRKTGKWVKEFETLMYKISIFDKSYVKPFFVNLKEYDVREFIEKVDPTNYMMGKYITKCEGFIYKTKDKYNENITTSASEEFTKKVLEFADLLKDYINYLGCNMVPLEYVVKPEDYPILQKIYSLAEQEKSTDDADEANDIHSQIIKSIEAYDNGKFPDISQIGKFTSDQCFVPFHREDNIEWAIKFDNAVRGFRNHLCELGDEIYKLSNIEVLSVL